MSDLEKLQRAVGEWGNATFPTSTTDSILAHLRDEVAELSEAEPTHRAQEAADCLLLLLHFAHRHGFSLFDAAVVKAAVNAKRTWQTEVNERGYMRHIESDNDR